MQSGSPRSICECLRRHGVAPWGFAHLALLWAGLLWAAPGQDDAESPKKTSDEATRPYAAGPLGAADFQAEPPVGKEGVEATFTAMLFADIAWTSRYRTIPKGRVVIAELTQFEAHAFCRPAKSWNRRGGDAAVFDHEQGHFDITQIHALHWKQKMRKLLSQRKPPSARGESPESAISALDALLQREYEAVIKESVAENGDYDTLTRHGKVADQQRELRRVHQETLRKLAANPAENNQAKGSPGAAP